MDTFSVHTKPVLTTENYLEALERRITDAMNAALEGTCKKKGIVHLQVALATLHDLRDLLEKEKQDKARNDPTEVIYYR